MIAQRDSVYSTIPPAPGCFTLFIHIQLQLINVIIFLGNRKLIQQRLDGAQPHFP